MTTEPTRRTFVTGLLAAAPAMALAQRGAQGGLAPSAPDPMWAQIMADLQRIYGELKADPTRRDSLRAFESAIRTHASYSSALGNPARLQRALSAQLRSRRFEFLEDARRMSARDHRIAEMRKVLPNYEARPPRRPDPSLDELEAAATALAATGHVPILLTAANLTRELAERKPQAIVRIKTGQWDLCEQMESQLAALVFLTGMVCAMTMAFPALMPECAALGATLAVMELTYFITCTWL